MNASKEKVNLNEAKGKLKQKFADLMSDDCLFFEGLQDEMFGKQQTRLEQTKENIDEIMSVIVEEERIWAIYYGSSSNLSEESQ